MKRIEGLDSLRGIAIALMVLDHFLAIVLFEPIETYNLRIITRLAEPIFAVLLGFFLLGRERKRVEMRMVEIMLASFFVNFFYFPVMERLEILATFFFVYIIFLAINDSFILLLPLIFLNPLDPTKIFLDYPLSLVISQVALGMLIRKGWNGLVSMVFIPASFVLPIPYNYTSLCTVIAVLLIKMMEKSDLRIPLISFIGKRPLTSYVIQYSIIVVISLIYYLALKPI